LGHIPAFYPQNKLNELHHFTNEMQTAVSMSEKSKSIGYRASQDYKELLAKAASAVPGPRRTHRQILRI